MRQNVDGFTFNFTKQSTKKGFLTALRLGILTTAILPLHGFSDSHISQYEKILSKKTLTVVGVAGASTFFQEDSFLHGFGYAMARDYAQDLKVDFKFKAVKTENEALDMVKKGQADFALTTANFDKIESKSLTALDISCGNQDVLKKNGLSTQVTWSFRDAADPLAATANGFVCNNNQQGGLEKLAAFYSHNIFDDYAQKTFQKDIKARLPIYKASFKQSAKKQNLDWHLLAAISYQESHLQPASVSSTGVTGLMMLTQSTAQAMGVTNRNDPVQSIQGGAQYFKQMLAQYQDLPNPDQIWFALAAYNMGPGAVDAVRSKVKHQGKNPDNWADVYHYLAINAKSNSRYGQCVTYVTHIRSYLESIKQDRSLATA